MAHTLKQYTPRRSQPLASGRPAGLTETRTWVGWHHHMAQTFLAHHFLMQVRTRLKKVTGPDHGPSATTGRPDHR